MYGGETYSAATEIQLIGTCVAILMMACFLGVWTSKQVVRTYIKYPIIPPEIVDRDAWNIL